MVNAISRDLSYCAALSISWLIIFRFNHNQLKLLARIWLFEISIRKVNILWVLWKYSLPTEKDFAKILQKLFNVIIWCSGI